MLFRSVKRKQEYPAVLTGKGLVASRGWVGVESVSVVIAAAGLPHVVLILPNTLLHAAGVVVVEPAVRVTQELAIGVLVVVGVNCRKIFL